MWGYRQKSRFKGCQRLIRIHLQRGYKSLSMPSQQMNRSLLWYPANIGRSWSSEATKQRTCVKNPSETLCYFSLYKIVCIPLLRSPWSDAVWSPNQPRTIHLHQSNPDHNIWTGEIYVFRQEKILHVTIMLYVRVYKIIIKSTKNLSERSGSDVSSDISPVGSNSQLPIPMGRLQPVSPKQPSRDILRVLLATTGLPSLLNLPGRPRPPVACSLPPWATASSASAALLMLKLPLGGTAATGSALMGGCCKPEPTKLPARPGIAKLFPWSITAGDLEQTDGLWKWHLTGRSELLERREFTILPSLTIETN